MELPSLLSVDKTINYLPKDIQNKLWKHKYDFSTADGVLASMGIKAGKHNRPQQPQQQKGQQSHVPAAVNGAAAHAAGEAAVGAAAPVPAEGVQQAATTSDVVTTAASSGAQKRPADHRNASQNASDADFISAMVEGEREGGAGPPSSSVAAAEFHSR